MDLNKLLQGAADAVALEKTFAMTKEKTSIGSASPATATAGHLDDVLAMPTDFAPSDLDDFLQLGEEREPLEQAGAGNDGTLGVEGIHTALLMPSISGSSPCFTPTNLAALGLPSPLADASSLLSMTTPSPFTNSFEAINALAAHAAEHQQQSMLSTVTGLDDNEYDEDMASTATGRLSPTSSTTSSAVSHTSKRRRKALDNRPLPPGRKRRPKRLTPDDEKDHEYWAKRRLNNLRAKRWRERKKLEKLQEQSKEVEIEDKNSQLKKEIDLLHSKLGELRDALKDKLASVRAKRGGI